MWWERKGTGRDYKENTDRQTQGQKIWESKQRSEGMSNTEHIQTEQNTWGVHVWQLRWQLSIHHSETETNICVKQLKLSHGGKTINQQWVYKTFIFSRCICKYWYRFCQKGQYKKKLHLTTSWMSELGLIELHCADGNHFIACLIYCGGYFCEDRKFWLWADWSQWPNISFRILRQYVSVTFVPQLAIINA